MKPIKSLTSLKPRSFVAPFCIDPAHFRGKTLDSKFMGKIVTFLNNDFLEKSSPATAAEVRLAIEDVLVNMINQLQPGEVPALDRTQQLYLASLLNSPRSACVLAILRYASLPHKIEFVDWCHEIENISLMPICEVVSEARRVLSILQDRVDQKMLLRPASASQHESPSELLRPIIGDNQ